MLAGSRDMIREALRHRKVLGGGMRQSGVLAAAALYALDHHVERLAEDHANARNWPRACVRLPVCGWTRKRWIPTWSSSTSNRAGLRRPSWFNVSACADSHG